MFTRPLEPASTHPLTTGLASTYKRRYSSVVENVIDHCCQSVVPPPPGRRMHRFDQLRNMEAKDNNFCIRRRASALTQLNGSNIFLARCVRNGVSTVMTLYALSRFDEVILQPDASRSCVFVASRDGKVICKHGTCRREGPRCQLWRPAVPH